MSTRAPLRAVFFDLDGTLADTAPDLAAALNALRAEHALEPLPFDRIRPHVSDGSYALVQAGFGRGRTDPACEPLRARLLDLYRAGLACRTRLFPGMDRLLDELDRRAIVWGIVTNKPGWLSEPLVAALGLAQRCRCLVSGDSIHARKPDPGPLLHAAALAGVAPAASVYVGDAPRDIEAARRAGMRALAAAFGYLHPGSDPRDWQADGVVAEAGAILDFVVNTSA